MGTRQRNRLQASTIINVGHDVEAILEAIDQCRIKKHEIDILEFGWRNGNQIFLNLLLSDKMWNVDCQKQF